MLGHKWESAEGTIVHVQSKPAYGPGTGPYFEHKLRDQGARAVRGILTDSELEAKRQQVTGGS